VTPAGLALLLLLATGAFEDRLLDTIPEDIRGEAPPLFVAQGDRVGYWGERGNKSVVDGIEGEPCDYVSPPVFAADGGQIGYGARVGRKLRWRVAPIQ
jgi:hypothetical protein